MVFIEKWQIYFLIYFLLKRYKNMIFCKFDLVFGVNVRKTRNFPKHKNYSGSVEIKMYENAKALGKSRFLGCVTDKL